MKNKNNILLAISLTLGIICYTIQTYNFLFGPSAKLQAVVQYSVIRFPPKFKDEIKELIDKEPSSKSSVIKQILSDLKFDGCWSAQVKNRGNLSCSGVRLRLPYSEIFMIKRENFDPVIFSSMQVVFIGDLAPLEELMVYGWTSGYKGPRFCEKSFIKLTHDKGIGRVILILPLRHYWYYISKHWLLILFLWTIVLYTVKLIFFIIKNQGGRKS